MRALIVGAGVAGLSTALAFERTGIDAVVVEGAPAPRSEGTALTLSFNALRAADMLGVGASIRQHGFAIGEVRVADVHGRTLDRIRLVSPGGVPVTSYALLRSDLLGALVSAVRRPVEYGREMESIVPTSTGATVTLHGGRARSYDLVIAADGTHSRIRRQVFPVSDAQIAGDRCWRFLAPDPRATREVVEFLGPSRRLGLIPLAGDEVAVFATVRRACSDSSAPGPFFADFPAPAAELLAAHGPPRPELIHRLPLPLLARQSVALVGDAAHVMDPNLAQGAALAMEDAVVLAACLTGPRTVEQALREYARQRRLRLLAIGSASVAAGSIAHATHPLARAARDHVLSITAMTGPALSRLLAWTPRLSSR